MLRNPLIFSRLSIVCLLAMMQFGVNNRALSQDAVNFLQASKERWNLNRDINLPANTQTFDFSSSLICFTAELEGRKGNFILDTGSPQVLINSRGIPERSNGPTGVAAGGQVALNDRFIKSFVLSGQEYKKLWALSLDLRPMEDRLGRSVDGFVGYDLLNQGEVRIDYANETFQLLNSRRKPTHKGRAPDYALKFDLVDHLPVLKIKSGKRKLLLALDTGASVNLLDESLTSYTFPTGVQVNVQGLDGEPIVVDEATLITASNLPTDGDQPAFVLMDLESLQSLNSHVRVDGILGSAFLSKFTVGIDYSRRRLYLWNAL